MSAAIAVQAALVAALKGWPALADVMTGIFDGPPAGAAYPYVSIAGGTTVDWSHKTGRGREHRLAIGIWDDGANPARLHALIAEAEAAIEAMPRALDGHHVASLAFLRSRILRDAAEPWVGLLEYRLRTLEA